MFILHKKGTPTPLEHWQHTAFDQSASSVLCLLLTGRSRRSTPGGDWFPPTQGTCIARLDHLCCPIRASEFSHAPQLCLNTAPASGSRGSSSARQKKKMNAQLGTVFAADVMPANGSVAWVFPLSFAQSGCSFLCSFCSKWNHRGTYARAHRQKVGSFTLAHVIWCLKGRVRSCIAENTWVCKTIKSKETKMRQHEWTHTTQRSFYVKKKKNICGDSIINVLNILLHTLFSATIRNQERLQRRFSLIYTILLQERQTASMVILFIFV